MFNIKKKHWNDRVCGFVMFSKEDNNLIVFLETERMRAEERERIRIAEERVRQEKKADRTKKFVTILIKISPRTRVARQDS